MYLQRGFLTPDAQLCTTLRITLLHTSWELPSRFGWKAFHWSYSAKCAQILLLNFCTAIFYDLNSIWHQIIWFCKLLVKLITGLKAQNSSAWRWRSLGSKCGAQVTSTPHLRWERFWEILRFERFLEILSWERFWEILHWERFSDLKVKVFRIKLWAQVTSTPHLRWERFWEILRFERLLEILCRDQFWEILH